MLDLNLASETNVDVQMSCGSCQAGLVLLDSTGKKIDADAGISRASRPHIKTHLGPGHYVLIRTTVLGNVGSYKLLFK